MPKKEKIIKVKRPSPENKDTLIEVEFTETEWALVNAYFSENMKKVRAYLKVFPESSYDSARSTASDYFAKPNIRSEIIYRLNENVMTVEEALSRKADIARATHKAFIRVDSEGFVYFNFSDPEALNNLHLIKKIKTKRERRIDGQGEDAQEWEGEWVEVELHDANAALTDILKMHGKFIDKTEVSGEVIVKRHRIGIDLNKV